MERPDRTARRRGSGGVGRLLVVRMVRLTHLLVVAAVALASDGGRVVPGAPTLIVTGSMPLDSVARGNSERALRRGRPRHAIGGFVDQLVADPSDFAAVAGLVEAGERAAALERVYEFLCALGRRTATLAVRLGQAETLFALGRLDASEAAADAVLARFPDHPQGVVLGALIQVAQGRSASIWQAVGRLSDHLKPQAEGFPTAIERLRSVRAARLVAALSPRFGEQLSWRGWRSAKRQGHVRAMQDFLQLDAAVAVARGDGQAAATRAAALAGQLPGAGSGADAYVALAVGFEASGVWATTLSPRVCRALPRLAWSSRQECALTLMEAAWRQGDIGSAVQLQRWLADRMANSQSPILRTRFAVVATPLLKLVGRWQEAVRYGEVGLAAAREVGSKELVVEAAAVLAEVLRSTGRTDEVADLLAAVAPVFDTTEGQSVRWLVERARSESADGAERAAVSSLQRARELASRPGGAREIPLLAAIELGLDLARGTESSPGQRPDAGEWVRGVPPRVVNLTLDGRFLEARGEWSEAIERYSEAGEALKRWLGGQRDQGTQLAVLRAWRQLAVRRARLALRSGDPAQALEAIESLSTVDSQPAEWTHVVGHLDDDTSILVFAPVGAEMWLWCVDKAGIRATRLPLPSHRLSELSRLWVTSVTEGSVGARWRSLGARLGRATIDVAKHEGWITGKSTLIVVPGGGLDAVPLDALVDLDDASSGGVTVSFVRTPSLSVLDSAWHRRIRQPWAVALVPWASIAGTAEAREVLSVMPGRMFLGLRATERALVREAARSSLIHFGGHAIAPSSAPDSGGLDLRPAGEHDGFLTYAEISRLPLEGAVVVLLGCDTSRRSTWQLGQLSGNPRSLSEAFLAAGSRSVVGNLWTLSEAAAGELAAAFYANGGPTAGAVGLAAAKRTLRRRHPLDPLRWAGAVWEGVPSAPFAKKPGPR